MTTDLARRPDGSLLLEHVLIGGDLTKLTPTERLEYYQRVCHSLGLNPLTKPFDYLHLNGKLILYTRRDATDQLRKLHDISVERLERELTEGVYVVTAYVKNAAGRHDSDLGAVAIDGLKGEARANAMLKAVTKAKRRATLSICGLGMLDETEIETIPAEALTPAPAEPARTPATPDPPPAAPYDEWLEAFTRPDNPKALEALWRGCTAPDLWETWSAPQQVGLTAAKNAAKKRLGVLT